MKYLKEYKIFENKLQDIEDMLLELRDDNFDVEVSETYNKDIKISICIPNGNDLEAFKFSKIEEDVRRIIDYLQDYKFSFLTWNSDTKLIKKDDLSDEDIILFQLWFEIN
jgi:hypothetical protein